VKQRYVRMNGAARHVAGMSLDMTLQMTMKGQRLDGKTQPDFGKLNRRHT
jgi:hypothetical protein